MGDGVHTDQRSHNHCDCTDGHCSSHNVASCVFVLLVPTPITRRRWRVPSTMSTSPSSSARASLVSLVKTHLATLPSQGRQLRTGKSDVYQQPIAGLTLLAFCCPIGAAPRVNVDFTSRCGAPFPSVSHSITRPADHRRQGHAHGSPHQALLPGSRREYIPQCLLLPCASSWVSEEPDATVLCTEAARSRAWTERKRELMSMMRWSLFLLKVFTCFFKFISRPNNLNK